MKKSIEELKEIIEDGMLLVDQSENPIVIQRSFNNVLRIDGRLISWKYLQDLLINSSYSLVINKRQDKINFNKPSHGGFRLNSGRKSKPDELKKKPRSFTLSDTTFSQLNTLSNYYNVNKSVMIELLINDKFNAVNNGKLNV